jgi:hypothetical protein
MIHGVLMIRPLRIASTSHRSRVSFACAGARDVAAGYLIETGNNHEA